MTHEGIEKEMQKCLKSPYYFATKYLQVNGKPFTTHLSEEEFNKNYEFIKSGEFAKQVLRKRRY